MYIRYAYILFIGFYVLLGRDALAQSTPQTPHDLIQTLQKRINIISEVSGNRDSYDKAEQKAVEGIWAYLKDNGDLSQLTAKNNNQMTPLSAAAYMGYASVVKELLQHPSVVADIEQTDKYKATAWDYSNFALRRSMIVCNPTIIFRTFSLVPFMVTQAYYQDHNAYAKTRKHLEDAGAIVNMDRSRERWNALCPGQGVQFRNKSRAAPDLQAFTINAGKAQLDHLIKDLQ